MKVICINKDVLENEDFISGKEYEVVEILDTKYCVIDEVKDRNYVNKNCFKIVE